MKLTQKQVRAELAPLGVTMFRDGQDYRVRLVGSPAGDGYFTTDLSDALATGKAMAAGRDQPFPVPGSSRETFSQFLTRCGKDQRESGRECTADDYEKAAKRIQELETLLGNVLTFKQRLEACETDGGRILVKLIGRALADKY